MRRYRAREYKYPTPTDPHWLVAVDLGKTKVGVSVFWVDPLGVKLRWGGTIRAPRGSTPETVAGLVVAAVARHATHKASAPQAWVCEWPEKYKAKAAYHKDLDSLYAVGYAIDRLVGPWAERYLPKEWKASVPKPAHHRRIRKELSPTELDTLADKGHDTLDATGIGLFATARHQRGGVT